MILFEYLRKSRSDDPSEPVEVTLARHRRTLEEYAAKRGDVISRVFEEVVSGESIIARPQMMAMLEAVEGGECDGVLCMDIDRLGRGGMKDQGLILETFKYSSTLIVTPEKIYNLSDENDEQMTKFKTFMSRQEYKLIKKRLYRGLMTTVHEGGYVSNPPFGYRKVYANRTPTLEIDENQAQYVRMIFDMYVNQGAGSHLIAEHLNSLGITGRRCGYFSRSTVRGILKNPTYTGKVVWNRVIRKKSPSGVVTAHHQPEENWIISQGLHPPIIDEETFRRAQEIRTRHHLPAYNTGTIKSPLAGLVICANCGSHMVMHTCRSRWNYIRCTKKGCCGSASFRELENSVLEHLAKRLEEITSKQSGPVDTTILDIQINGLQRDIAEISPQKSRIMSLLEQGVYSVEEYQERVGSLMQRLSKLQAALDDLSQQKAVIVGANRRALAERLRSVLMQYGAGDPATQNRLLKTVVDRIEYSRPAGRNQPFSISVIFRDF